MSKNAQAFPPSIRALLGWNILLHTASGVFTGLWVATLVAPTGDMTALNWLETLLAAGSVAIGLSYGSYMALRHIPHLPIARRSGAMAIFIAAYTTLALVLAVAAASVLGAAAGEVAHMEASLQSMKTAADERRAANAQLLARVPVLEDCTQTAEAMSVQETKSGAFSREGRDFGRVAVTLANIAQSCTTARDALLASRAPLLRLFDRSDRLLLDVRRTIDSDLERPVKLARVRKAGETFQKLMRGVNDALMDRALQDLAQSLNKDWSAAGLPTGGASAITQNFSGMAEMLSDGLDDIAALKASHVPHVTAPTNIAYLVLYPDATMGAVAIGFCIEIIPLFGLMLGFAILTQDQARMTKASPARLARKATRRARRNR